MSFNIYRRETIKRLGLAAAGLALPKLSTSTTKTTHIISLSFDDGFKKSFFRTADIYEQHGLEACFNVLASGHHADFVEPDEYMKKELLGDFEDWAELQKRGHEIMPHGFKHANLSKLPFTEAQDLITRCLDYFSDNLEGFRSENAVFNFPFNASSPELENWLDGHIRAYRLLGDGVNAMPSKNIKRLTCSMGRFTEMEKNLRKETIDFLTQKSGWFIFNLHGLGNEGWEPISDSFLDEYLDEFKNVKGLEFLPTAKAANTAT